jgi:hypothetical protein
MIKIPQPSMALNARDSPIRYRMHVTYDVPATEEIDVVLRQVRQAALRQAGKALNCLAILCHGFYRDEQRTMGGYGLALGRGIGWLNSHHFSLLREGGIDSRPLVDHIMITACGAAAVSPLNKTGDGNGVALCKKIAMHSGAHVTASDAIQLVPRDPPPYHIDDFEGLTRRYAPSGRVTWQHEYDLTTRTGSY